MNIGKKFVALALCLSGLANAQASTQDELPQRMLQWLQKAEADSILTRCTPQVRAQLTPTMLKGIWSSLTLQAGSLKSQGEWTSMSSQGYEVKQCVLVFEKSALRFNLVLDGQGQVAGLTFTPAPMPQAPHEDNSQNPQPMVTETSTTPSAYKEQDIRIEHDGISLPGALTLPAQATGQVPLVVLIQGSGPNDRDETIGPNKPFKQLATALAEEGIATIRFDKRTHVYGMRTWEVSHEHLDYDSEVVDDAVQALKQAAACEEVDSTRIYLLGHSLGGTLAPRIAQRSPVKLGGIIYMAAMARPFWTAVEDQLHYICSLSGANEEETQHTIQSQVAQMKSALPEEYLKMQEEYDAVATAKSLSNRMRMLFLQGGHDYQVTDEDFLMWRNALHESHANAEFKYYSSDDHLMRTLDHKATPDDYAVSGAMDKAVVKDIATFIKKINKLRGKSLDSYSCPIHSHQ